MVANLAALSVCRPLSLVPSVFVGLRCGALRGGWAFLGGLDLRAPPFKGTWRTLMGTRCICLFLKDLFCEMLISEFLRGVDIELWSAFAGDSVLNRRPFGGNFNWHFIGLRCL